MNTLDYLQDYILKDETIDENEILENDGLIHMPVKKQKQIVIYKTKVFILSNSEPRSIPSVFQKQWKRRTESDFKKLLNISSGIQFRQKLSDFIKDGFIVKVIEYKSRGIEVSKEYYIPSVSLQRLWADKDDKKLEKERTNNKKYLTKVKELKNPYHHPTFEILRKSILEELHGTLKVNKRIDFLTAVLITASQSPFFDWKEIGLNSIGSEDEKLKTKIFDNQRNEYIKDLQLILNSTTDEIGLTTVSGEYFIEFCARCRINFSFGNFDYEKAEFRSNLTGEEVFSVESIDRKDIKKLYLFENRAMLRKLIKHISADTRKDIVMLSFDGQVRSSQYYLCKKWLEAGVKELIVWTDFDEYALSMVKKLYTIGFESFKVVVLKNNRLTLVDFLEAKNYFKSFKNTGKVTEQENYLKDLTEIMDLLTMGRE